MSRHRLKGPHRGLKIRRKIPQIQQGTKVETCQWIDIYTNLCGRITALRNVDENELEVKKRGKEKANERQVILTPNFPLCQIRSGDYLSIPWGVRPNIWCPLGVPPRYGPCIWISTPNGNLLLDWKSDGYYSDLLIINYSGDQWQFSGELDINLDDLITSQWPDGYSFLVSTGPIANFEILRMEPEMDHLGHLSFYNLRVETEDQDGWSLQE